LTAQPRPAAAPRVRYRIQALDRAAAILNAFDVATSELSVREVSERTRLHKSTAHRILMALQQNGLVEQDPVSGRYHLGLQLVKLGEHAVARLDVRVIARPYLVQLCAETEQAVHLAVMDGDQVVILDRVDPASPGAPSLPGRLFPAHSTATGKAMLASLDEFDVRRILGRRPLKRLTPRTITSLDALLRDLQQVRERGYAVADEEMGAGISTVGGPVRNLLGVVVAGLRVAGWAASCKAGGAVERPRIGPGGGARAGGRAGRCAT
jgi:DNA-binding IclR family transcriptional regulator